MTLDELAQLTGVSRAVWSQIETRKTNPTIGVLCEIASGLGIPFVDLIGESRAELSVSRRGKSQPLCSLDGKFERWPLMPAAGIPQVEMYELQLGLARVTSPSPTVPESARSWWC